MVTRLRRRRTTEKRLPREPFGAIADPIRRSILDGLRRAPEGRSVNEIAAAFAVTRPAISRHLRILRHAGLVREERMGRKRVYRLDAAPLGVVDEWLTAYRLHLAAALVSLKEHIESESSGDTR